MTDQAHPIDALHDAVSGRLGPDALATLQAHLATCDACRRELEAMTWLARQTAAAAERSPVPADLAASVTRVLDEATTQGGQMRPRRLSRRAWLAIGGTAAAAVVGAVAVRRWGTDDAVYDAAAADLRGHVAGTLPLAMRTSDPAALAAHIAAANPGFASDVYDFGMMGFRLDGGGVHELAGHTATMAAYRGEGGLRLVCQMYPGRLEDLATPLRSVTTSGVTFFVYDVDGVTVVCWQSGPLVCVLAANGDPDAALALAVAKGVPA